MEISSTASSSNRRPGVNSSQFCLSTECQQSTEFDLLLALPVFTSPVVEQQTVDEPPTDEQETSTCENCTLPTDQPEATPTDEAELPVDEDVQADLVASLATIDSLVTHQNQPIDQQPTPEQVVSANPLSEDNAAQSVQPPTLAVEPEKAVTPNSDATDLPAPAPKTEKTTTSAALNQSAVDEGNSKSIQQLDDSQPLDHHSSSDRDRNSAEQAIQNTELSETQADTSSPINATKPQETIPDQGRLENTVGAKIPAESTRRGVQRERPARWYEQSDSKAITADEADNGVEQLPEDLQLAPAVETLEVSALSQLESSTGQSPLVNELGIAETSLGPLDSGAFESSSPTTTVTTSLTTSTTSRLEAASEASLDSSRSISAPADRNGSKQLASGSSRPESSQTGPQVDVTRAEKAKMVQRVARSFSRIGPTGGNVQIKLHPPELGALAVQVRIEGKSMSARLTTESQAAKEVIMESLPQLRSRLAEQGYDVVQFTVDVATDGSSLSNHNGAGQGGQTSGNSDSPASPSAAVDLRRSNYLRRQMDAPNQPHRSALVNGLGLGVDIQA